MDGIPKFSTRHGHSPTAAAITVREDAPAGLRGAVIQIAAEVGLSPDPLRKIVCRVLRETPDPSNWSEYPNIASEVDFLLRRCQWYRVYDIIEAIWRYFVSQGAQAQAVHFQNEMNTYFGEHGIGWQLADGVIVSRGPASFETVVRAGAGALGLTGRVTAEQELREAIGDLSRRPTPDLSGAVHHALASLECVMRDVCGDAKATLGDLVKRYPGRIPRPLDSAVEKLWGYSSETGRHMREGGAPSHDDAQLVVGIAAVVATYLVCVTTPPASPAGHT